MSAPPIGYALSPHPRFPGLGYEALTVYVYDQPTGEHFDPRKVFCTVAEEHRGGRELRHLHIEHPWSGGRAYTFSAGRIILEDHKGKRVEVFAWGGGCHLESREAFTRCVFHSPVPMLLFDPSDETEDTLISEFEALLARRRAAWEPEAEAFERRLASLEPERLFAAAIRQLSQHLKTYPAAGRTPAYWRMRSWVEEALLHLREHGWSGGRVPPLEEIL